MIDVGSVITTHRRRLSRSKSLSPPSVHLTLSKLTMEKMQHQKNESKPITESDAPEHPHNGVKEDIMRAETRFLAESTQSALTNTPSRNMPMEGSRQETHGTILLGLSGGSEAPQNGVEERYMLPVNGPQVGCARAVPAGAHRWQGGRRRTFPIRLHTMLSDVESMGQADIVSWQPHGRCFVVHKSQEFVDQILGSYFRQTKWSSFQRQLNLYGFGRISTGPDRGGYYHNSFLRGQPALCHAIFRTKVKGTKVRVPSNSKEEPNFYAQPPLGLAAGFHPQLGLPGHDRWLFQTMHMQMLPSSNENVGMLPLQPSATVASSDIATFQGLATGNPPFNYAVFPYGAAPLAFVPNQGGVPISSIASIPVSSQGIDLSQQLNAVSSNLQAICAAPEAAALSAEPIDGSEDSKPSAVMKKKSEETSDSIPQLPKKAMLGATASGGVASVASSHSSGGSSKIPDDPKTIQNMFDSLGQSFTEGDLDKLPKDDQEWGKFLKGYFG